MGGEGVVNATPLLLYHQQNDTLPVVQKAGWAPVPFWTGAENLGHQPGFDPRTVRSVATGYTNCAIPGRSILKDAFNFAENS